MDITEEGDVDENQLQACYVLHKGSTEGLKSSRGSTTRAKGKTTIISKDAEYEHLPGFPAQVNEPTICGQWRLRAFYAVWGRIQKLIEDIMEDQNQNIYGEIQQWICNRQYGDAQVDLYRSAKLAPLPVSSDTDPTLNWPRSMARNVGKQLHTALLFLGGVDPSDHQRTFGDLVVHLREHKCHVAPLTSLDFSPKAGIGGALQALFRQLIGFIPETTDMEILVAWHHEPGNDGLPVVIVIENAESCESKILAEFIILLSEWIAHIPMVLIMGMPTTSDAVRTMLPANALVRLRLWRFTLKSPPELLEVVMRAVMIDSFCAFELGHQVVAFLHRFFQVHDLTVTAITRSLKVASMKHFWKEPLSFLCGRLLKVNSKVELEEECAALPQELLSHAATLPSVKGVSIGDKIDLPLSKHIAESLWQLRARKKMWGVGFLCLHAVGKIAGIGFAELLCEALLGSMILPSAGELSVAANGIEGKELSEDNKHVIVDQLMAKLREMPVPTMKNVLEEWRKVTIHEKELNTEIAQLLSDFNADNKEKAGCFPESEGSQEATNQDFSVRVMNRSKLRRMGQQQSLLAQRTGSAQRTWVNALRTRTEDLLQRILAQYLVAPESQAFNEIFCFKDVKVLKQALIGETRKRVHLDLLNSCDLLKCKCCPTSGILSSSLHDTSLAYGLSQDHGDLIKVHKWYQSFAAICCPKAVKGSGTDLKGRKCGGKKKCQRDLEPLPKADPVPEENVSIEARFTRAATELQIVGLLQLPKKGQSDSIRRICM